MRLAKKGWRSIVGELNMQTYGIAAKLRKEGVECHILALHAERKPSTEHFLFDSCIILAIGGMLYNPKRNTLGAHVCMGAQSPPESDGYLSRGFPASTY